MKVKFIDQLDLQDKNIIIRVDYNVPYDKNLQITDDTRIKATFPTIKYCQNKGNKIILISHLGRPKGKPDPSLTLKPVAERLSELLNKKIKFIPNSLKTDLEQIKSIIAKEEIVLLENIRFYPEEEKNDSAFAQELASLAEVYINDAFATAHRGHASNEAITNYISIKAAGFLLKNEIEYFSKALQNPQRPLGAIIGGAKVSSKLKILENIVTKVDFLIIGGGMAFTFLKAQGSQIGNSILEEDLISTAKEILSKASKNNTEILLPLDILVAEKFDNESPTKVVKANQIPANQIGLDIGPETINLFSDKIKKAQTIIWNGPMGAFEMSNFATGTKSIAKILADSKVLSIVGGGDSVTALKQTNLADKMSYISTGGGAFLELLEGKTLPGIVALEK